MPFILFVASIGLMIGMLLLNVYRVITAWRKKQQAYQELGAIQVRLTNLIKHLEAR